MVFVGGQNGLALYALSRTTGQLLWSKPCGSLLGRNPIPDGDRLYIVKDSLLCLNGHNGATIWSYPFTGTATPAVDDSYCYLCGKNRIRAFHKMTGALLWERYNNIGSYATLMVDETRVYSVSQDSLVARNKQTGAIEWGYQVAGAEFPDLVVGGAAVCDSFVCFIIWENIDGFGQLYTLNKADGSLRWNHTFPQSGLYAPTIANNVVYITTWREMELWGFDLKNGDSLFYDNSQSYNGQIIVANHTLYAGTQRGVITFVSAENKVDNKKTAMAHSFVQWQNYPNPFNPATTITFELPDRANVEVVIFDVTGRKVRTLLHERRGSGEHIINWDGRDDAGVPVSSGVYLCKLSTDKGYSETKKMTLVK